MIDVLLPEAANDAASVFGVSVLSDSAKLLVDDSVKSAASLIAQSRKSVDLVMARTSSRKTLMSLLENRRVDVVFPDLSRIKLDKSIANMARDNCVAIGVSLPLDRRAMRNLSRSAQLLERKGVMLVLSTSQANELRSLASLLCVLGFSLEYALQALETPRSLIERNKTRGLAPGVSLA